MPTSTDTRENGAAEAIKVAQDAARRYADESASIGRIYFSTWFATTQASMRTTFEVQNAVMQASRAVLDSAAQANSKWIDQAAESMRKSQDATAKLINAGVEVMESAMPKPRV